MEIIDSGMVYLLIIVSMIVVALGTKYLNSRMGKILTKAQLEQEQIKYILEESRQDITLAKMEVQGLREKEIERLQMIWELKYENETLRKKLKDAGIDVE